MSTSTVAPSGHSVTMRGRKLEDFEKEEIIARLKAGVHMTDVATQLGVSLATVHRLASRNRINRMRDATIKKNQLATEVFNLRSTGMSCGEIAKAKNLKVSSVYKYLHLARHDKLVVLEPEEIEPEAEDKTYARSIAVVQEYARGITWAGQAPPAWLHRNIRVLSATMTTRELAIMLKCPQFEILKIVEGRKCANM